MQCCQSQIMKNSCLLKFCYATLLHCNSTIAAIQQAYSWTIAICSNFTMQCCYYSRYLATVNETAFWNWLIGETNHYSWLMQLVYEAIEVLHGLTNKIIGRKNILVHDFKIELVLVTWSRVFHSEYKFLIPYRSATPLCIIQYTS